MANRQRTMDAYGTARRRATTTANSPMAGVVGDAAGALMGKVRFGGVCSCSCSFFRPQSRDEVTIPICVA